MGNNANSERLTSTHWKWIGTSIITYTFDLYDLFTILLVTPFISALFFPSTLPVLSLVGTYAAFGISFVTRPFGAAYFGIVGDKVGRRRAIIYGALGLVITATLLAALPTYEMVGVLAPALLIAIRLAEGFFVGGLAAGSHTIGPENVPERYRGLVGGFVWMTAGLAYLIAAGWFMLTAVLYPGSAYLAWGWRVMFLSGLFPLAIILFVNYVVPESEIWNTAKRRTKEAVSPLRTIWRRYRRQFAYAAMITGGWAFSYYLTQGLFPSFLLYVNHLSRTEMSYVMMVASVAMMIGPVLGGEVSQLIGRKWLSMIAGILNIVVSGPTFYYLLPKAPGLGYIALYVFVISFFSGFGSGMVVAYLNESYPTLIRATGAAFTWNVAFAVGGLSPTIATSIMAAVGGLKSFPLVMMDLTIAIGIWLVIASLIAPETKGFVSKEKAALASQEEINAGGGLKPPEQ
ncbi:MAG: MFS transporter [Conexivisphaera sp.]